MFKKGDIVGITDFNYSRVTRSNGLAARIESKSGSVYNWYIKVLNPRADTDRYLSVRTDEIVLLEHPLEKVIWGYFE